MRYKDFKNGKPYTPSQTEVEDIAYSEDPIVNTLKEKINAYNFLQELSGFQAPMENNIVPEYQQGGTITVNSKNDPRYRAYQDSLALYNFSNKLDTQIKNKIDVNKTISGGYYDAIRQSLYKEQDRADDAYYRLKSPKMISKNEFNINHSDGYTEKGINYIFAKPNQKVSIDSTPQVKSIGNIQQPQVIQDDNIEATQLPNYPQSQFKTYGVDRFQNRYLAKGEIPPAPGRSSRPQDWNQDVEMVWLKDPQELGVNRQKNYGYNVYNESYKNAQEGVDYIYMPVNRMENGGQLPMSSNGLYDYPNQQVLVPTDGKITMKGIDYPVIGKSLETGEVKMMMPNKEYNFNKTKTVLEIPLISQRLKNKR